MNTTTAEGAVLAEGVRSTRELAARFHPGFTDANRTRQAPGLPNHFAWNLGHLALTLNRVAAHLDGAPLPADHFIENAAAGDARRFGTESVSFASEPKDAPGDYPTLARCVEIFDAAIERLARAAEKASRDSLDRLVPWGAAQIPLRTMISRMIFHNGVHVGQITDLRRALGFDRVLVPAKPAK